MATITNSTKIFDTIDIEVRINELEATENIDDSDKDELEILENFKSDIINYTEDWYSGVTLIRDDYFENYAQELACDIGAIQDTNLWPSDYINWQHASDALKIDYQDVDFDGITYWFR